MGVNTSDRPLTLISCFCFKPLNVSAFFGHTWQSFVQFAQHEKA